MKRYLRSAAVVVFLLNTFCLLAEDPMYRGPDQQQEYDACQGSLNPDVCMWSPMGGGGVTITACTADGYAQCTKCAPLYSWNGTYIGSECQDTKTNASCRCSKGTREGCTEQGACTYNGFYWH
jgi:hypothetical protein